MRAVPIGVDDKAGTVTWGEVPLSAFGEPFFGESIERLRRDRALVEFETDLDPLLPPAASSLQPPSGFIFHMSRCGSTVITNALRQVDDALVISEARVVSAVLAAGERKIDPDLHIGLIRGTIAALGNARLSPQSPYFMKFGSWNVLQLHLIRAAWPGVPWAFVCRDPLEVMVSHFLHGSGWLAAKSRQAPRSLMGWTRSMRRRMGDEEFLARVLGRFLEVAAQNMDDLGCVIDYQDISPKRVAGFAQACGVIPSTGDLEAIARVMRIDARDATRERLFAPDGEIKQAAATPLMRDMTARFALPPYKELLRTGSRFD